MLIDFQYSACSLLQDQAHTRQAREMPGAVVYFLLLETGFEEVFYFSFPRGMP